MKYPNGYFKPKPCRRCGGTFEPAAPSQLYCSSRCKEQAYDDAYYRRTYGESYETVSALREEQGDRCYICGGEGFLMRDHHRQRLVVDHDHDTGQVRKLLCHNCNRALGLLQDDPDLLRAAAAYIEDHKEGATTIPEGSRAKRPEARCPLDEG